MGQVEFLAIVIGLAVGMLLMMELGRRVARKRALLTPSGQKSRIEPVEGAVYAVMGLLLTFTFFGAASRFDRRKEGIIGEAIAISTAYSRLDLLHPEHQAVLRPLFRKYVDLRRDVYRALRNEATLAEARKQSSALENEIWRRCVEATAVVGDPARTSLLLASVNEMFDAAFERAAVARWMHPPRVVYGMLFLVALTCALFAGHGMATSEQRPWLYHLGFVLTLAAAIYVTLDLEFPRAGWIRIDDVDQAMSEVREGMD